MDSSSQRKLGIRIMNLIRGMVVTVNLNPTKGSETNKLDAQNE